jgi:hypothetical protein
MPGRKAEYDSLAFAVICVIFLSLIFWILSLSTDIALVLSPQAVNSCLGGLGKARKGLMAQAQKSLKMGKTSNRRITKKDALGIGSDMDDPNSVKTEINQYALMRGDHMNGKSNTSEAYVLSLKKQNEENVQLIQELRSQLDERNSGSASRQAGRPQAVVNKKSFSPIDVTRSENPLNNASGAYFEQDSTEVLSSYVEAPQESPPKYEEKLSKLELFKAKMKAKSSMKFTERVNDDAEGV